MDKIEWRPVKGFEDKYEVSNTGMLRRKAYLLKTYPSKKGGHHQVNLGAQRRTYLHRLIAEAFLPEPLIPKIWVNHKNGNPSDNHVENLEWCTPGENIAHGYQVNGRIAYQSKPVAALDAKGNVVATYASVALAAKTLAVTPRAIHSALQKNHKCCSFSWVLLR